MSGQTRHFYAFGPFRLDSGERVLLRDGVPVPLPPKAVETLLILVQNAGHLVDKDDLVKQVWPDAFVEEGNLTKNVFFLRKVLGRGDEGQEYIETVPRRGYRFAAKVRTWSEEDEGAGSALEDRFRNRVPAEKIERIDRARGYALAPQPQPIREAPESVGLPAPTPPPQAAPRRRRWLTRAAAAALAISAAIVVGWVVSSPPAPTVLRTVQLTRFGRADAGSPVLSDGAQLYFVERLGGRYSLARVSVDGGEPTPITTPFRNTTLYDISPDHSELLVGSFTGEEDEYPLWILPASGGSPRRLGDVTAHGAAWSPDGQSIVYASGSGLYLVRPDGSESRKLASMAGLPQYPRWSPDGRVLRFTLEELALHTRSLCEVSAEGRNPHPLLPGWREPPTDWGDGESGGDWTPDGKYFVFRSTRAHMASIWAIRERPNFLRWRSSAPVLLTTSELYLWNTLAAGNGKRVFFAGGKDDRELERYDSGLNQFVPYLSGVSARWASFSRDSQWVAYVTVPGFTLWRSRVDGSDRLQLTFPPMGSGVPRWSPDGKHLAFSIGPNLCVLSSAGGNPQAVAPEQYSEEDPEWSPDGNALLFSSSPPGGGPGDTWALKRLDLKTHQVSQLPGSQGLRFPAFSPDWKYVAAIPMDATKLMLFEVQSRRWTELAQGASLYGDYWSRDGKYIYSQDLAGVDQPVFRVRISDHKAEVVTTLKQFPRADAAAYSLAGLTPEDEPLASLLRSSNDIYALDVDFP